MFNFPTFLTNGPKTQRFFIINLKPPFWVFLTANSHLQKAVPPIFWAHLEGFFPSYQLETWSRWVRAWVWARRNGWNPFLKGFQYRRLKSVPPCNSLVMSTAVALSKYFNPSLHCGLLNKETFRVPGRVYLTLPPSAKHFLTIQSFAEQAGSKVSNFKLLLQDSCCFNLVSNSIST